MELKLGYRQTDVGVLPADWLLVPMKELFTFQNGINADKKSYGTGVPFINVLEIITHPTITEQQIPGRVALSARATRDFIVRTGDVLFNRTSETQEEIGLASVYVGTAHVVFGGFVIRASPLDLRILIAFRPYGLRAPAVRKQLVARGQGAVRANIGQHDLSTVVIPLPRRTEQQAIADVLSGADALIKSLEQLLAKKRQVKQGAAQELLTARRRLPGFSGDWREESLGELGRWTGGMTPPMRRADYWNPAEIPWISSGDVKSTKLTRTGFSVSRRAVQEGATTLVPANALVLVVRSGILRKYLPVAMTTVEMAVNQDIKALASRPSVKAEFLLQCLMFNGSAILARCLKSGTTVESIEFEWLKDFRISLPPYSEQIAIAEVLSHMDREIEDVEAEIGKVRKLKEGMMQNLLTGRIRLVDVKPAEDLQLVQSA